MARKEPVKYVAAKSSGFTDKDAVVIGVCLRRIAEQNKVGNIRSLDKDLVLQEYEAGKAPELEPYLEQDQNAAQRAYWLTQIGKMIRSVRVIIHTPKNKPKPIPRPQFVTCRGRREHGLAPTRSRVITEDVMASDPYFASAFGLQVRITKDAVRKLEHLIGMKPDAPAHMATLPSNLRAVLDEYGEELLEGAAE